MKTTQTKIKIRDLVKNYSNTEDEGVLGFNKQLNIRPPYQREFIYKDKQRNAVIETIKKGHPLNIFWWSKNKNGSFELLDGQQRTISICQYVNNEYSIDYRGWVNLSDDEKEVILNYEIDVYICEGTESEKLAWFQTINIGSENLNNQELRNAIYAGYWTSEVKKYFSKRNCPAYNLGGKYLKGTSIRQDYLETVIKWISNNNIENYMAKYQHEKNILELKTYFENVIQWTGLLFPNYRNEMKGIEWGYFYNKYKDKSFDSNKIKKIIELLMLDDEVTNKKGVYEYIFDGNSKHLHLRSFTENQKRQLYEKQKGICNKCNKKFDIKDMEADHILPWSKGGKTDLNNCQILCRNCNRVKGNK